MNDIANTPYTDWRLMSLDILRRFSVFLILLGLVLAFSIMTPEFLGLRNLLNVTRQISIVAIVSVGMTFVILTAGNRSVGWFNCGDCGCSRSLCLGPVGNASHARVVDGCCRWCRVRHG